MRIFDTTIYNGEADLLEIRFNILNDFVDYFVIVEGTETFSGKWKPLYWAERGDRFSEWEDKVIYVVVQGYRDDEVDNLITDEFNLDLPFFRAFYQKECIRKGLSEAKDEDVVIYGDIDEITSPQILEPLKLGYQLDRVWSLEQLNYCYYLNNRSSEKWIGTVVGKWGEMKTKTFKHWRATHTNILPNGGWHFTSQGGLESVRHKLESYDHQEFATTENFDLLEERMEKGQDYLGRSHDWLGTPFSYRVDGTELPQYLLDNKERWKHLFK